MLPYFLPFFLPFFFPSLNPVFFTSCFIFNFWYSVNFNTFTSRFRFRMESIDCWFTTRIPCIFSCCFCGIRNCSISVSNKWCDRENRYAILIENDDFDVDEICVSPKRTVTLNYPISMKSHAPVVFILILRSTSLTRSLFSWRLFDFIDFVHVFFCNIRRLWQWMVAAHSH